MTEDKLAEALAQYKQAIEEEVRCALAYNQAKSEDLEFLQAKKEAEELYAKYCDANDRVDYLKRSFDENHKTLLKSIDDACCARRNAQHRIDTLIRNLNGVDNEW